MIDALNRLLAPLRTRVANMVSRAVVKLVDDSLKVQNLQLNLLDEETRGGVERVQNYGFTSVPLEGAEAVALAVGGKRDHLLVVAVDDRRYRLKGLADGEVAVYTDQGDKIVIHRGGTVTITASTAIELGGNTEAAIKGTSYTSAEATFLTALTAFLGVLGTYAAGIKTIADPTSAFTPALATGIGTLTTAVGTFTSAGTSSLSTKVKLS